MARYIDADRLDEIVQDLNEHYVVPITRYEYKRINGVLCEFPTVDVHEVRHGKWQMKPLFNSHFDESDVSVMIRCSECGMKLIAQKCGLFPNYCPNCGADMRERREDDIRKSTD